SAVKSKTALYNSWSPENLNPGAPRAEEQFNFSNAAVPNSYPIEKGTYFRNKSIILGYNFSASSLKKIKAENLRIYIQLVNLFTLTRYSGLDPELPGNTRAWGLDEENYPGNQKQYLVGVHVSF